MSHLHHPLRGILPALLLLAPALPAQDEAAPATPRKKLSAVSLLPNGSELMGVMFPRFDENHRLVGVLKAATIILVNEETIAGEKVAISFSNPDGSPRGHIDLKRAVLNQTKGILEAAEPVTLESDRLSAKGTGLYYAIQEGEGFLTGPATTWIKAPIEKTTTMNSSHSPLRTTAIAGISLLSQALAVAPPAATEPEDLASAAAPAAAEHAAAARVARMDLRADLDTAAATAKAKAFLEQADLVARDSSGTPAPADEAAPLEVDPGPTDTVITCDGGMYFDADAGVFVYLKNVRVADPRFALSGANELKIFLAKKPQDPKTDEAAAAAPDEPADPQGLGIAAKFGDVERIVATGAVRILQKETEAGKQPVEASGAIFSYHPDTGRIILSGGYPWVKQGTTFMRAKEPNLTLRIHKSGSFVTEGNWDMGGNLNPG